MSRNALLCWKKHQKLTTKEKVFKIYGIHYEPLSAARILEKAPRKTWAFKHIKRDFSLKILKYVWNSSRLLVALIIHQKRNKQSAMQLKTTVAFLWAIIFWAFHSLLWKNKNLCACADSVMKEKGVSEWTGQSFDEQSFSEWNFAFSLLSLQFEHNLFITVSFQFVQHESNANCSKINRTVIKDEFCEKHSRKFQKELFTN